MMDIEHYVQACPGWDSQPFMRRLEKGRYVHIRVSQRDVCQRHLGHRLCADKGESVAAAVEASKNPLAPSPGNLAYMRKTVWSLTLD